MSASFLDRPDAASDDDARSAFSALAAVSRLLGGDFQHADEVHAAIVREAYACLRARHVVLVEPGEGRRLRHLAPAHGPELSLDDVGPVAEVLDRRIRLLALDDRHARALAPLLADAVPGRAFVLLLAPQSSDHVAALVCAGLPGTAAAAVEADAATAFADAASAVMDRRQVAADHARQVAREQALTRAAKGLNESLDLDTVLSRICLEAATILDADLATVYRRSTGGLQVAATHGMPPEAVGWVMPEGAGLAGKVAVHGRAMLTNDYGRIAALPEDSPVVAERAMAAPMRWDGELRGVLSLGYQGRGAEIDARDLRLLETFAELAALACANASAHAGLARVARTDGLTGCLNHAALHAGLAGEIERLVRHGSGTLSLVLFDLDDFKQVNEAHGHLVGDEVLRRAGHALRQTTRPYDLAARYGGDEFALVAVESDEAEAQEIAGRALACIGDAIRDLAPGTSVGSAGVAEWQPGIGAVELVARADRALLFAKHEGGRGTALPYTQVADHFRPGRFTRTDGRHAGTLPAPEPSERPWPERRLDDRMRKRTRQLAAATALGARLAAMTDVERILDAVVDELHRAFGFFCVATIRLRDDGMVEARTLRGEPFVQRSAQHWSQRADAGLIGRCLRERRPVLSNDVLAEPEYRASEASTEVRSELVVPLWVGELLWGAINVEETETGAFDDDDLLLLRTVADQVGAAMRSAQLYEQLERAYLGTAEALAAALEAKDAYTAEHARSIVEQAEAVAAALGLGDESRRDVRFAAVFHDIGKIAVPERILGKPGPLDDEERAIMQRHTVVGEQILAPVEFLSRVRTLVRHEHERYDGLGYPDGLAGEEIPLGSRIILACDALHAMTSDRPYRGALPLERALDELRRHAGTQFDPRVVETLTALVRG